MITRRRFFTAVAAAFVAKKLPVPKAAAKVVPWSTAPVLPVGLIYAPYIPRYRSTPIIRSEDFVGGRDLFTRYNDAVMRQEFYTLAKVI